MNLAWEAPLWLAALPGLWGYCLWLRKRSLRPSRWSEVVDPPLLDALIRKPGGNRAFPSPFGLTVTAMSLAVLALAGPLWSPGWGNSEPLPLAPWLMLGTTCLAALAFRQGWMTTARPDPIKKGPEGP